MACRPLITMSGHRGVKFGIGCTLGGVLLIPRGPKCIFGVEGGLLSKSEINKSCRATPKMGVRVRSNLRSKVR